MPDTPLPSLLLRQRTDVGVLDELMTDAELTRAEISVRTGFSKPTISESIARLIAAGLVAESGRQSGKRGPAGTFVRLRDDVGVALAVAVGPAGLDVVLLDLRGAELRRDRHPLTVPARAARVGPVLVAAVRAAVAAAPGPVLGCAVSVAGPVDRHTGRVVRLGYTPFLLDELPAGALLGDALGGAGVAVVDNDVNLAALAEHDQGVATDLDDFAYVYLGAGVGGAVVIDGVVQHGRRGLAGELAHLLTVGPGHRATTLADALAGWGLHRPGSVAIDLDVIERVLTARTAADRRIRTALVAALAGVLGSVVATLDPQAVVLGGPWAGIGGFDRLLAERLPAYAPHPVELRAAAFGAEGPLLGARIEALRRARVALRSIG